MATPRTKPARTKEAQEILIVVDALPAAAQHYFLAMLELYLQGKLVLGPRGAPWPRG